MTRLIKAGGTRVVRREVADAKREAAHIREDARAAGFEEGLARATETIVRAARAEKDLPRLGVRIAEKILGRELSLHPETVADMCERAIAEACGRRRVVVRVHPDDLPLCHRDAPVEWCADPAVARGGCVVETEAGVVDARLASQLAAIERALVPE